MMKTEANKCDEKSNKSLHRNNDLKKRIFMLEQEKIDL